MSPEPLLLDRDLDFPADSNVKRLTLDLSEHSPDINLRGKVAAGMTKAPNYRLSAELKVIYAGLQPTNQYPTISIPFTSSMQSFGLLTSPGIYGTWKELDAGIVIHPSRGTMQLSARKVDLPEAGQRIQDVD